MDPFMICNMALSFIGNSNPVSSFADNTTESRLCSRYYDIARKTILSEFPWSFAKRSSVSLVADTTAIHPVYAFVYDYPADALRILRIGNGVSTGNVDYIAVYEVVSAVVDDGSKQQILCDIADARADYIADVEDAALFSAWFIEALAWKIAANVAVGLSGDPKIAQYAEQRYAITVQYAKRFEGLQLNKQVVQGNRYITARS